jgi:hypothetical protein
MELVRPSFPRSRGSLLIAAQRALVNIMQVKNGEGMPGLFTWDVPPKRAAFKTVDGQADPRAAASRTDDNAALERLKLSVARLQLLLGRPADVTDFPCLQEGQSFRVRESLLVGGEGAGRSRSMSCSLLLSAGRTHWKARQSVRRAKRMVSAAAPPRQPTVYVV